MSLDPCAHGASIDFTLQIAVMAASCREELVSASCGVFESPGRKLPLLPHDMSASPIPSPCNAKSSAVAARELRMHKYGKSAVFRVSIDLATYWIKHYFFPAIFSNLNFCYSLQQSRRWFSWQLPFSCMLGKVKFQKVINP